MSRSILRSSLPALALLLVVALVIVFVVQQGGSPSTAGSPTAGANGTAGTASGAPGVTAENAGEPPAAGDAAQAAAGAPDRTRVAPSTVVHGAFAGPRGVWPGGGTAELRPHADPPPGGMFGLFDLGMSAARQTEHGADGQSQVLAFLDRAPAVASARVRADGSFRFEDPPPGRYAVRLTHPTLRAADHAVVTVEAGADDDVGTIPTVPAASVLVLVADTEGQPIVGAHVELGRKIDPREFSDPTKIADLTSLLGKIVPLDTNADARGVARFDGLEASGPCVLSVEAKDRVAQRQSLALNAGQENVVRIELISGAALSVRVLDPDGASMPEARLELRYPDLKQPAHVAAGPMGVQQQDETVSFRLACGDDGTLERRGLPAGRAELHARTPGFKRTSQPVTLRLDETTSVTVKLDAGVAVRGRVVDGSGHPVPDSFVLNVPMVGQEIMGFDMGDMLGADVLTLGAKERGVRCDAEGNFVLRRLRRGRPGAARSRPRVASTRSCVATCPRDRSMSSCASPRSARSPATSSPTPPASHRRSSPSRSASARSS